MVNIAKENLCIHKLVAEKREVILVEGEMIVPDSKPDILSTIHTSGVVCMYKKEVQEGKIRIDGNVNTFIMYLPDGTQEGIRGLNTSLDFSEMVMVDNCTTDMETAIQIKVKSIECKVINGRKIGLKASLEVCAKVYTKENVDIVNEISDAENIQMLKEELKVNSLLGTGETKIYAKDTVQIDAIDQLAEILKVSVHLINKDIKVSYNKVLTKAEAEMRLMYLTEDNRIGHMNCKIPVVGFIDIENVEEQSICDVSYEMRNIVIKPNAQEEHSIYVEMEIDVSCLVYEERQINLIQDLYRPGFNLKVDKKQVMTMSQKQTRRETKQISEKVRFNEMEGKTLIDVDSHAVFVKENKIHTKIMYEGELSLGFIFLDQNQNITRQEASIPFEYVIEDIQHGEAMNTENEIEIANQDFVIQDGGEINCRIDMTVDSNMYRNANMNVIDQIAEEGEREEQDYSIIMYLVKEGDSLWKIAKRFGSTIDDIARTNGIEDRDKIMPGQKLFIPRYVKMPVSHYA